MAKNNASAYHHCDSLFFLDYQINPQTREVMQSELALKLSKKSYELLLFLIKNQGKVVSKQDMIDAVWTGQIVTDAALNKQVARLRQDLNSEQEVIETIRGIGVRFIPEITNKPNSPKAAKLKIKRKISYKKSFLSIFFLTLVAVILTLYLTPTTQKSKPKTNTTEASINLAIVPSKESINWLNIGGLNYLSEKLQKHKQIQTLSPHTKWFNKNNQKSLAIQMSQKKGIDYVLSIHNLKTNKTYSASLELRNHDSLQAKASIKAQGLNSLFDKIDAWVVNQLAIKAKIAKGKVFNYKTTDFVLESYLRGRETAIHNSYKKASQLFETAYNQDPSFLPALTALAETEARLGNNEKALALIETVIKQKDFNPKLSNKMLVLKASFLTGMNKLDEAQELLEKAISLSKSQKDYSTLIDAITIAIQSHFKKGKISDKTISLLQTQITLLTKHKPDTYLLALANYNLAGAYHQLGQVKKAIKAINKSNELYTIDNNSRGRVISASLLARIYKDTGNTGKALTSLESVEGLFEQIDGIDEQQIYLQYKAENLIYHGLRKQALETITKLEALNQQSSSLESKIVALSLRLELNEIHKDYAAAKNNVRQMLAILKSEKQGYPPIFEDLILVYDLFVSALTEQPEITREKIKTHLKTNPNIQSFFEKEMRMINATVLRKENKNIQAAEIYRQLISEYIQANQLQDAFYYAGYPLLDILWEIDKKEYQKNLNYLDELTVFKYPIHKYKAQLLAYNKDYINAYVMMSDLKSKANEFWTTQDQIKLEEYQQLAQ